MAANTPSSVYAFATGWADRVGALDASAIGRELSAPVQGLLGRIDIFEATDSTNEVLLRLPARQRHGCVVLSERQSAGRGRRGRSWRSPDGNIWMSAAWHFDDSPALLSTLGLVVGVCVCRALARFGLDGHGIKWPNDILLSGAKLGGILVELSSRGESECDAVIGVGVNVRMGKADGAAIGQPWTDLCSAMGEAEIDRNRLIAFIVDELLARFDKGAAAFRGFLAQHWPAWDLLAQQAVRVEHGDSPVEGTARGISEDGSLRVWLPAKGSDTEVGNTVEFHSGEVSVRRA